MTPDAIIAFVLAFVVQLCATLLALWLYQRMRQALLLGICQSLLQIHRANLALTPSLLHSILAHHQPPKDIENLLIQAYGRDRYEMGGQA